MASEQEILQTLSSIISKQMRGSAFGSAFSTPSFSSSEIRDERARAKEAAKILNEELTPGIKELPKEIQKAIDRSGNKLAKDITGSVKTISDVLRVQDQISAMRQIAKNLEKVKEKEFSSLEEANEYIEKLNEVAKKAGISLDKLGIKAKLNSATLNYTIQTTSSSLDELKEATEDLEEAFVSAKKRQQEVDKATEKVVSGLKKVVFNIRQWLSVLNEEMRYGMQRATADAGYIKGLEKLNISQIEYHKILAQTRQEQLAGITVGQNFIGQIEAGAERLRGFAANNEEAARAAMIMAQNAARFGVSQENLGNAVEEQTELYKKNARALGMSAEEAAKFTADMLANSDVRLYLARLQEKDRKQYALNLIARQKEYKALGYTTERATELQKTFAQMVNQMSPKQLLKQTAKTRAMLGALGMGAEGAELMRLQMRLPIMGEEERRVAEKRITEIMGRASNMFLQRTGAGATMGQYMAFGELAQATDFKQYVDKFETTTGKGLKFDEKMVENTAEINSTLKMFLQWEDYWKAMTKTGVLSAGGQAGSSLFGNMLSGAIGGAVTGLVGRGVSKYFAAGGMKGIGKGILGGIGKGATAAAGAAKMMGGVGKQALKTGIKKIPVIGALAGLVFAAHRLAQGDITGAGLEAASGLASVVPGVGTAASLAIDAYNASRDLSTEQPVSPKTEAVKETRNREDVYVKFNTLLEELLTYLRNTNDALYKQSDSVAKTADSISEAVRLSKLDALPR